jgi:hypothetical protein
LIALIVLTLKIKRVTFDINAVVKGAMDCLVLGRVTTHWRVSRLDGFGVQFFNISDGSWNLSMVSQAWAGFYDRASAMVLRKPCFDNSASALGATVMTNLRGE